MLLKLIVSLYVTAGGCCEYKYMTAVIYSVTKKISSVGVNQWS